MDENGSLYVEYDKRNVGRFKGSSRDPFLLGKTSRDQDHIDFSMSPWFPYSVVFPLLNVGWTIILVFSFSISSKLQNRFSTPQIKEADSSQ